MTFLVPDGESQTESLAYTTSRTSTPVGEVPEQPSYFAAPVRPRRARLAPHLREEVITRYRAGETSREVAEACSCGKATVLKILKEAWVEIRLTGAHY